MLVESLHRPVLNQNWWSSTAPSAGGGVRRILDEWEGGRLKEVSRGGILTGRAGWEEN